MDISELLKIYYDEWKYRLDNFRKHISQLVITIFLTTSLPISVNIFNGVKMPQMPLIIFPISGTLLTFIFLWFCLSEASRIAALDSIIKFIVKENFPDQYTKNGLTPVINKCILPLLKLRMTIWIPIFLSIVELFVAIMMVYLILSNSLVL